MGTECLKGICFKTSYKDTIVKRTGSDFVSALEKYLKFDITEIGDVVKVEIFDKETKESIFKREFSGISNEEIVRFTKNPSKAFAISIAIQLLLKGLFTIPETK